MGLVLCAFGASASPAAGASQTVNCAGLQAALNQAHTGDTITLDQLCTKSNSGASDGTFTLASGSPQPSYRLVGKPSTGAGFDGTGISTPILQASLANAPATFTLRNLVFKNAPAGAVRLDNGAYGLALTGDTFTNDKTITGGDGGAVSVITQALSPTAITIKKSNFHGDVAHQFGGAVYVVETGPSNTTPAPVSITGSTFTSNAVRAAATGSSIGGGAVALFGRSSGAIPVLTQSRNAFRHNSVTGGNSYASGGAEGVWDMQLTSTDETFTRNSIQAPVGTTYSEGSALSIRNDDCFVSAHPSHVTRNLVIAGNSIADGGANPSNAWGALYLGCGSAAFGPNALTLINSTISGNRGGGGTAGIWGDDIDQLTLENSILAGDSDGTEVDGFNGSGGTIMVTHSDLCAESSPFTGTGNICANPLLVNAVMGNVREKYSSPAINSGSNHLVPSGLASDAYGDPRIAARRSGGHAVVDMGAAEFVPVKAPSVTLTRPANGATYSLHQQAHSAFTCTEAPRGPGIASCLDSEGHRSGARVDTSTAGTHKFKVIAISQDGLRATTVITYTVKKS